MVPTRGHNSTKKTRRARKKNQNWRREKEKSAKFRLLHTLLAPYPSGPTVPTPKPPFPSTSRPPNLRSPQPPDPLTSDRPPSGLVTKGRVPLGPISTWAIIFFHANFNLGHHLFSCQFQLGPICWLRTLIDENIDFTSKCHKSRQT